MPLMRCSDRPVDLPEKLVREKLLTEKCRLPLSEARCIPPAARGRAGELKAEMLEFHNKPPC